MRSLKAWALSYLVCPGCKTTLLANSFERDEQDGIISGVLVCSNGQCGAWYPVVQGVPRLLTVNLRVELTRDFVQAYGDSLSSYGLAMADRVQENDAFVDIKQKVGRNFGFEWLKYDRFGWDDQVYNIAKEEDAFHRKAMLEKGEIEDKLVLDAGCGNGRYSYWAAQYGARVIGVELGDAVESAARNTADLPNVQIVQGDIFSLPFPPRQFDAIFSIGVLMLTGDARRATLSLTEYVKQGGSLTVHVYGKGNLIYEAMDRLIRLKTTRMSIPQLEQFTDRAFRLRCWLERRELAGFITRYIRLDDHPHCIFDWYSAPSATHHTYEEVMDWLEEGGLQIVARRKQSSVVSSIRGRISRSFSRMPSSVTVKGIRQKDGTKISHKGIP